MSSAAFRHETFSESAGRFHSRDLLSDPTPQVVVCRSNGSALVLGSVQRVDVVDAAAAEREGVETVRRRSGGGAVLVEPGGMVWFDVVVPADDPRFAAVAADVTKSMRWIGSHVVTALEQLGVAGVGVHNEPMRCGDWCRLVCFAGTAPGEVVLGGAKLVGISQRRTRTGSRFQCAVHTRWSPDRMVRLLAPPRPRVEDLPPVAVLAGDVADELPGVVSGVLSAL